MAASFPDSVKSFPTLVDLVDSVLASHQNDRALEISAVETWLRANHYPSGVLFNGKISVTVASNNITVAIKTLAGSDPSATDPVFVLIQGTLVEITAALSVTVNAGVNTFAAGGTPFAALEQDYFVYMSTDGKLGFSRKPNGTTGASFSGTATNEGYIASSSAIAAGTSVQVIGRFAATLSAAASYNWSVPTFTADNLVQFPKYQTRWLTYLPTFTNLTVGNGTLTMRHLVDEKYWYIEGSLIFGSTSSISGTVSFTLPYTNVAAGQAHPFGLSTLVDNGTGVFYGDLVYFSSTTARIRAISASGTYASSTPLSSTVPFTWTTSDEISFSGKFRY